VAAPDVADGLRDWGDVEVELERCVRGAGDLEGLRAGLGQALGRLRALWKTYGAATNLTSRLTDTALDAQMRDALSALCCVMRAGAVLSGSWVDVGSGGGFPGLVVAAAWPGPVVLVEPRGRRAAFLELACGALGRGGVVVERSSWERSTWNGRGASRPPGGARGAPAVLSARAVWAPDRWAEIAAATLDGRGRLVVHGRPASLSGWEPVAVGEPPTSAVSVWRRPG